MKRKKTKKSLFPISLRKYQSHASLRDVIGCIQKLDAKTANVVARGLLLLNKGGGGMQKDEIARRIVVLIWPRILTTLDAEIDSFASDVKSWSVSIDAPGLLKPIKKAGGK